MGGNRSERIHDDDPDFRRGDEGPDAHLGAFAVYGGAPADRRALQEGDPQLTEEVELFLKDVLEGYGDAVGPDKGMGRTPFDDTRDEIEGGQ